MKLLPRSITFGLLTVAAYLSAQIAPGDAGWPDTYPAWWYDEADPPNGLIDATQPVLNQNNGMPLATGQLKHIASVARDELDTALAAIGGADSEINTLVDAFIMTDASNLSPANIGQLKAVSSTFFNRFAQVGFTPDSIGWPASLILDDGASDNAPSYPWHDNITATNTTLANLGQAKHLFSWDLSAWTTIDSENLGQGDGLPDYWENYWFASLEHDASYVAIEGGFTLAEAYAAGTDPNSLDSDGDGFSDKYETEHGLPVNYNQSLDNRTLDSDGDGLTDFEESTIWATNPTPVSGVDSDGDGVHDGQDMLAHIADITLPRIASPSYAIIDLGTRPSMPRPDGSNTSANLLGVNNKGTVFYLSSGAVGRRVLGDALIIHPILEGTLPSGTPVTDDLEFVYIQQGVFGNDDRIGFQKCFINNYAYVFVSQAQVLETDDSLTTLTRPAGLHTAIPSEVADGLLEYFEGTSVSSIQDDGTLTGTADADYHFLPDEADVADFPTDDNDNKYWTPIEDGEFRATWQIKWNAEGNLPSQSLSSAMTQIDLPFVYSADPNDDLEYELFGTFSRRNYHSDFVYSTASKVGTQPEFVYETSRSRNGINDIKRSRKYTNLANGALAAPNLQEYVGLLSNTVLLNGSIALDNTKSGWRVNGSSPPLLFTSSGEAYLQVDENSIQQLAITQSPKSNLLAGEVVAINDLRQLLVKENGTNIRKLWQNGRLYAGEEILAVDSGWSGLDIVSLSDNGHYMVGTAVKDQQTHDVMLLKVDIAVDADRSGTEFDPGIQFGGADQTTEDEPYLFWVNNDNDSGSDDEAEDLEPTSGTDYLDGQIDSARDLEDFSRLWINVDGIADQLKDGSLRLGLEWKNVSEGDDPAIRLYDAVEVDGGMKYLFDENVANQQKNTAPPSPYAAIAMEESAADGRIFFPEDFWDDLPGDGIVHFLFEAVSAGKGELVFSLQANTAGLPQDIDVSMSGVWFDLKDIKKMYEHWTVGDTTNASLDRIALPLNIPDVAIKTSDSGTYDANSLETNDYILFVHGWNMETWERRYFAETAYKRLYWQGYTGRFGLFSWPTEVGITTYPYSEFKARLSAVGLEGLLKDLKNQYNLHVMAHSMGNVVMSEALKRAIDQGDGKIVGTYIASQAASVAHAYDSNATTIETGASTQTPEVYASYPPTGEPYYKGIEAATGFGIINFYNEEDYALNLPWRANQDTKPDLDDFHNYEFVVGTDSSEKRWRWTYDPLGSAYFILDFPEDHARIYSNIAESRSNALGDESTVSSNISGSINGNESPFNYGAEKYEHSAQFRSTNQKRWSYWKRLLDEFGLSNN